MRQHRNGRRASVLHATVRCTNRDIQDHEAGAESFAIVLKYYFMAARSRSNGRCGF